MAVAIRSKNAGPYSVTIDVFCGSDRSYETIRDILSIDAVARLYRVPPDIVRRFELPTLNVFKFSFPRPAVQGSFRDRDMHAAQLAELLKEHEVQID